MPGMDTNILTSRERERFTLGNLVRAHAADDKDELSAFRSLSDAVSEKTGKALSGFGSFLLPPEALTRDLQKAGSGTLLVGVEHDFASALAAASLTERLPLRRIPLTGDLSLGIGNTVATTWVSESAQITHADPTFGAGAVTPKTVSAVVNFSHQLWRQTGASGHGFVERELARAMAAAVDTAFVQGSGAAGQPTGLLTLTGTTSTSGTSIAYSNICDMLAASEGYDVDGVAFIVGVAAAKVLRQRAKTAGGNMVFENGRIDGVPVYVSKACPDDALVVAPFGRVIAASWGGLEVAITSTASASAFSLGQTSVRLMRSIDFLVEKPALVGKSTSIT